MDGVVHPNVEQAIGRDRIRKALKRYENRPADEHRYGIVRSVNEDGSYEVLLDGDVQTSRCAQYGTALVGDRVLAVTKKDGRNDLIGRLGGEVGGGTAVGHFENVTVENELSVGGEGIFNDIVNFRGNQYLANSKYLSVRKADGTARNALGMNSSDQLLIGYGAYSYEEGSTNLYGNQILMMDKGNGNAICSLNGGFLLPEGADLNDYVTVGNYYSNNSTLSSSLKNTPYTGGSLSLKVICPYGTSVTGNSTMVQEMTVSNGRQYWRRTGDTGATWTDWYLNLSGRDVLDYPTSEGTSGGWHYWKFANGLAIVSRVVTCSSKIANAWGGVFESASYWSYSYPFTFAAKPALSISQGNCADGGILSIQTLDDGGMTKTPTFFLTRGATGGSYTYDAEVSIIAIGRWK